MIREDLYFCILHRNNLPLHDTLLQLPRCNRLRHGATQHTGLSESSDAVQSSSSDAVQSSSSDAVQSSSSGAVQPSSSSAVQPLASGAEQSLPTGAGSGSPLGSQNPATKPSKEVVTAQLKQIDDMMKMIKETEEVLLAAQNVANKEADAWKKMLEKLLSGDMSVEYPATTKVVRIFTSSTFTDTKHERNSWMEHAYPRLKDYCQSLGYEFQVVDMRWGVRMEATNDHSTTELCLQELRNCQSLSTGPFFVSLLSHKYGYRSLNREVEAEQFTVLLESGEISSHTGDLLLKWYIRDDNASPPVYVLQPISKFLPEFLSTDRGKQVNAKKQWWAESEEMTIGLGKAAKALLPHKEALKYIASVTEIETIEGMLQIKDPERHCIWFQRVIEDIEEQPPSYQLSRYLECLGDENQWKEARELQKSLQARMKSHQKLIHTYKTKWSEKGIDPHLEMHANYLKDITVDFEKNLKQMIKAATDEQKKLDERLNEPVVMESIHHGLFCKQKVQGFHGREDILLKIKEYIQGKSTKPLILHGLSGSGKTSIMAAAADKTWEWINKKGMVVIRFLGTTPFTSTLTPLLISLTSHIYRVLDVKLQLPKWATVLKIAVSRFRSALKLFIKRKDEKFVFFFDSVDQLEASQDARKVLSWLPKALLENVKVIISTLEDKEMEAFPHLKAELPEESFINIPNLQLDGVSAIIDTWAQQKRRRLTPLQQTCLMKAFENCPLPLFLKLSAEKAFKWTSFQDEADIVFENSIQEAIHVLFASLEIKHGETFVKNALGYLTAAKQGLSEAELEDILSCDDSVLNDVYQFWTPPIRRLPPLLLVRLRTDLQQYLVDRGADGVKVISWYHRQFTEVAQERFLSDDQVVCKLHQGLAEFFSGTWSRDIPKPFKDNAGNSSQAVRYVAAQPLKFDTTFNARKLKNLPYHLINARMIEELKKECLMNLVFLETKIQCADVDLVIEDFQMAHSSFKSDQQLHMMVDTMYLAWNALRTDHTQISAQFLDRLSDEHASQILEDFLNQCLASPHPYLKANTSLLTPPGGELVYTLPGHSGSVIGLDCYCNHDNILVAVTGSSDDVVKMWDVSNGHLLKSISDYGKDIRKVMLANADHLIITDYIGTFSAFDLQGNRVYSVQKHKYDFVEVCGTNGSTVVVVGEKETKVYSAVDGKLMNTVDTPQSAKISLPVITAVSKSYIALTGDIQEMFGYFDIESRTFSKFIKEDVEGLAISKDETQIMVGYASDKMRIKIFDLKTLQLSKVITLPSLSFESFGRSPLKISPDGSFLYFASDVQIAVLNIKTEKLDMKFSHPQTVEACFTLDGKTWVTTTTDSMVRVWKEDQTKDQSRITPKTSSNSTRILEIFPFKNTRYVLLQGRESDGSESLQVYDIMKEKVVRNITQTEEKKYLSVTLVDDVTVAVATETRKIKLIDLKTMTISNTFQGFTPKYEVYIFSVIQGQELLSQSRSRCSMKLYDIKSGKTSAIIRQPPGHSHTLGLVNMNLTRTVCSSYTDDEKLLVYDLKGRTLLSILSAQDLGFTEIGITNSFSDSGDNLIIKGTKRFGRGSTLDCCVVWDVQNKNVKHVLLDKLKFLACQHLPSYLRPDLNLAEMITVGNDHCFCVAEDGNVQVFDIHTGKEVKHLPSHSKEACTDIAYAKCGPFVVTYNSIDEDNSLRLMCTSKWNILGSFQLEKDLINIKMLSDGKSFVGVDRNHEIHHFVLYNHEVKVDMNSEPELFIGKVRNKCFDFSAEETSILDSDPDQEKDEEEIDFDDDD